MEARNKIYRSYIEENKVDILGIDDLGINVIEVALSDLVLDLQNTLNFHDYDETKPPIDVKDRFDKANELLRVIKDRKEE